MINFHSKYFRHILTRRERNKLLPILIIFSIVSAILEAVSLSVVLPVLKLIDPSAPAQNENFISQLGILNLTDQELVQASIILAVIIIFMSSVFRSFATYFANMKINQIRASISTRLYQRYLQQDLQFFSNEERSIVVKNITSEVDMFTNSFLLPIVQIFTNFMLLVCISIVLVTAYPKATLFSVIILGSVYAVIFSMLRNRILEFGRRKATANGERFKIITESISDLKLLKISNKEEVYVKKVKSQNTTFAKSIAIVQTIAATPRYLMETISLSLILISLFYFISSTKYSSTDIQALVPMFGLFVLAAMKLLPAIQIIYHSAATARAGVASANILASKFKQTAKCQRLVNNSELDFNIRIKAQDIFFSYGKNNITVIENFNLIIEKGSVVAFVGPTGSGKTTCVDILLGLLNPSSGNVLIDDTVLTAKNLKSWHSKIGYVPQEVILQDWTVYQNVADKESITYPERSRVIEACKLAAIHHEIVTQFPDGYDTFVGERGDKMSGGQRQRIGIARALFNSPEILVLDEATSALDERTSKLIQGMLINLKGDITQIIISHQKSSYQHYDQIVDLEKLKNKSEGCLVGNV